jgi:hypothetical protein
MAWQWVQVCVLARAGMSVAVAEHATISPADAMMLVTKNFINSPFLNEKLLFLTAIYYVSTAQANNPAWFTSLNPG